MPRLRATGVTATRDFIPEIETPTISAASRAVSPSSSTSVTASRYGDGNCATNSDTHAAFNRSRQLDSLLGLARAR